MSNFTYEYENKNDRLERFEWDNLWINEANSDSGVRALYIGDSISLQTRSVLLDMAGGEVLFDNIATSKAVDNPYYFEIIKLFAAQEVRRDVVLFNSGLHGWHLSDDAEYRDYYEKMITFLREVFPSTPIFLVLTTAVADGERNGRVIKRNKVVRDLAGKYNLPIIDFYSMIDCRRELICDDGVHLLPEGCKLLSATIIETVKTKISEIE